MNDHNWSVMVLNKEKGSKQNADTIRQYINIKIRFFTTFEVRNGVAFKLSVQTNSLREAFNKKKQEIVLYFTNETHSVRYGISFCVIYEGNIQSDFEELKQYEPKK